MQHEFEANKPTAVINEVKVVEKKRSQVSRITVGVQTNLIMDKQSGNGPLQTKEVASFLNKMTEIRKRLAKVDPRMVYYIER